MQEPGRNVSELTDKSYVSRQHTVIVLKTGLRGDELREVREIVAGVLDLRSQLEAPWIGERMDRGH